MKLRAGFVSNSSSTSFLIAVPKEPVNPEHKELLKLYGTLLYKWNEEYPTRSIGILKTDEFLSVLKDDIKQTKLDIKFAEKHKKEVDKFISVESNAAVLNEFFAILQNANSENLRYMRLGKTYPEKLSAHVSHLSYEIDKKKRTLKNLEDQLELLNDCNDIEYLASYEMDNYECALGEKLKLLADIGVVKIIKKDMT